MARYHSGPILPQAHTMTDPLAQQFIRFALDHDALRFGEFTLKSGRVSPYFFNAGRFHSGAALARLGAFYARAIVADGIDFDMLFGPAYKGIPLATASAMALATHEDRDVPWCFNRKEAKDHGEGGALVGAPLAGRVLIVDDVITAGTAIGEAVEIIRGAGAQPAGVVICLDRQERGAAPDMAAAARSAVQEVAARYDLRVIAIARLADLLEHLSSTADAHLPAVAAYRRHYGIDERAEADATRDR